MKNTIRRALAALGYELRRTTATSVPFENFANLAAAYEIWLNEQGAGIPASEGRPKLLARLMGTPPSEAYFIVAAIAACRDIPGDVCEFGVAQGETSALIANEIAAAAHKRLHLFDSFEGLPKPSDKDRLKDDIDSLGSMAAYAGGMSYPEDMVRRRLAAVAFPQDRYVIHKGFIEQSIRADKALPQGVSFAYVDFDFYEPIKVALDFLHGVMPAGAMIIVDDYDYFSTGAKTAVDEFVESSRSKGALYDCVVPDKRLGHFAVLTKKN